MKIIFKENKKLIDQREEIKINQVLSPDASIANLFGSIMNDLDIIRDSNFDKTIKKSDFSKSFHKIIFTALENLKDKTENNSVTPYNIKDELSDYPLYLKHFLDNNGELWCQRVKETCDLGQVKHNIDSVKKYSLLRKLAIDGFDISKLYDYNSEDELKKQTQREELSKMSRTDVLDFFAEKLSEIKFDFQDNQLELTDFQIGDDLDSFIEKMNEGEELGYSFKNNYYNTLFRGQRPGKLLMRSGATGSSKSRQMLTDALWLACSHKYEGYAGWQKLPSQKPTLFISTELNKLELQVIAISYLTGVSPSIIQNGYYDNILKAKVEKAIEILKESPLYMVYVEDFTINDIENIINRYIKKNKVEFVFFDYIQLTPALSKEAKKNFGSELREDQILIQFTTRLKQLAEKYNIYISTATQLNRNANDTGARDATSLRGSVAMADKIDYGVIISKLTKEDKKQLKEILKSEKYKTPNYSHWVYKNRAGQAQIVLWTYIDMATMQEEFCFATDYSYSLIQIDEMKIKE